MKTLALITAALLGASATAAAQSAPRRDLWSASHERVARAQPAPAWMAPADNTRPAFAAHVSANGQGTN